MRDIEPLLKSILKPILKNYSPIILILKRNWRNILGEKYYEFCEVEKVFFGKNKKKDGILYITCFNNVISFYVENNKFFIIEKVNSIFGYSVIKDLRIVQQPRIIKNYLKKTIELKNEDKEYIKNITTNINDESLKDSLKHLGESILFKND